MTEHAISRKCIFPVPKISRKNRRRSTRNVVKTRETKGLPSISFFFFGYRGNCCGKSKKLLTSFYCVFFPQMEQKSFYFREFSHRAYYYFFAGSGNQGTICSLFPISARMYRTIQKCQVHIFPSFLLTRRYGKVSRQMKEDCNIILSFPQ